MQLIGRAGKPYLHSLSMQLAAAGGVSYAHSNYELGQSLAQQ
jgi:hypothetical protein